MSLRELVTADLQRLLAALILPIYLYFIRVISFYLIFRNWHSAIVTKL